MDQKDFKRIRSKLKFLRDVGKLLSEQLSILSTIKVDILDQMFLMNDPQFKMKDQMHSLNNINQFKIISKSEHNLFQLQ